MWSEDDDERLFHKEWVVVIFVCCLLLSLFAISLINQRMASEEIKQLGGEERGSVAEGQLIN